MPTPALTGIQLIRKLTLVDPTAPVVITVPGVGTYQIAAVQTEMPDDDGDSEDMRVEILADT